MFLFFCFFTGNLIQQFNSTMINNNNNNNQYHVTFGFFPWTDAVKWVWTQTLEQRETDGNELVIFSFQVLFHLSVKRPSADGRPASPVSHTHTYLCMCYVFIVRREEEVCVFTWVLLFPPSLVWLALNTTIRAWSECRLNVFLKRRLQLRCWSVPSVSSLRAELCFMSV